MSSTPVLFRLLNPVMIAILRSPLHSMLSNRIMVISFTGRKTGRTFTIPVSYCREDGTVICFTHAQWWRNLAGGRKVQLLIRKKEYTGKAISICDDQEKKKIGLTKLLTSVPKDAVFYGVAVDQDGTFNQDDLARAAAESTMVEISLEGSIKD
jgi:hypothetical protein